MTLPNRIVVSPMCQYSADDGCLADWHLAQFGSLACSGAGLLDDPRSVWHAAERFGVKLEYPPQYARCHPSLWPGAELARPRAPT